MRLYILVCCLATAIDFLVMYGLFVVKPDINLYIQASLGYLVGLIDSDYQGQLFVSCLNRSNTDYEIEPYERIAQLVFITIEQPKLKIVDAFAKSPRGSDGFGSSGKK